MVRHPLAHPLSLLLSLVVATAAVSGSGCKSDDSGSPQDAGLPDLPPVPNELGLQVLASEFMSGVRAYGSAVLGEDKLLVAGGKGGLKVYQIGGGGGLTQIGALALDGHCVAVAASGKTGLVACGEAGVHAIDLADPAQPKLARTVAYDQGIARDATDVKIHGDVAFVLDRNEGVYLLRPVQMPDKISPFGQVTDPGTLDLERGSSIAVTDGFYYVADTTKGLHILSYKIPESPHLEEVVPFNGGARSVVIAEGKAYCATHQLGMVVADLSKSPPGTEHLETPNTTNYVAVRGPRAFIADGRIGTDEPAFLVAKLDDPRGLSINAVLPLSGEPRQITIHGDFAFVSAEGAGIYAISINNPDEPKIVAQIAGGAEADALARHGDLLLVTAGEGGLYLIDTADPKRPQVRSVYLPKSGDVTSVAVSEGKAYVLAGIAGMHILDLSNPDDPAVLGTYHEGQVIDGAVAVEGDRAYVASTFVNAPGLQVIDVADPAAPKLLGRLDEHNVSGTSIAVAGELVYFGEKDRLFVADVSDPAAPTLVTQADQGGSALRHAGQYLYAGPELMAYDLKDPRGPRPFTRFPELIQGVTGIDLHGKHLFTTAGALNDGKGGLHALDLDRLWGLLPAELSWVSTPGVPRDVLHDPDRGLTFVADGPAGLTIIGKP